MYNSALVLNCVAGPEFLTELFPLLLLKLTVLPSATAGPTEEHASPPGPCHTGGPAPGSLSPPSSSVTSYASGHSPSWLDLTSPRLFTGPSSHSLVTQTFV